MGDVSFNCPECGGNLSVDENGAGMTVPCPLCSKRIRIPRPQKTPATPPPPPLTAKQKETIDCPFCGEEILATAIKCKHCGEFLDGSVQPPPPTPPAVPAPERTLWTAHTSILYYIPMIVFGVILIPLLVGVLIILYAILDQRGRVFTVTNKRVMSKWGIISRKTNEVTIADIRNINMSQGILERLFGLGSIEIGSAGTAGIEVKFAGVSDPVVIRDLVRNLKDKHR